MHEYLISSPIQYHRRILHLSQMPIALHMYTLLSSAVIDVRKWQQTHCHTAPEGRLMVLSYSWQAHYLRTGY